MSKFSPSKSLVGRMNPVGDLSGKIGRPNDMSGNINIDPSPEIESYDGDYIVIPKAFKEQVLETKGKKMEDNVTVKEIPYYETSNIDGGETVYIAGEV